MTIARRKKKVKQKERVTRKKRRLLSGGKKRLVLNTNAEIKKLQKQAAALKKQVAALKAKSKRKRKAKRKKKVEPGTLLSPRSEAARRGWTTRRANQANRELKADGLSDEALNVIRKAGETFFRNEKQIKNEYVVRLPEYLMRKDTQEFLVERKENQILHRLIVARWITGNFDEMAYELAEEYQVDASEIYGLWHGYELEE